MKTLILLRHGQSQWNKENRFTGWTDVPLSDEGVAEAEQAAKLLREGGYAFDLAYTSVLKRAIKTLWIVLEQNDLMWIPVVNSWRLNERMYGALQGLDKAETAARHGADQVKLWRRSYDIPPPAPIRATSAGRRAANREPEEHRWAHAAVLEERYRSRYPPRRARAHRRTRQQPACARERARRDQRRRNRGPQHPDGHPVGVRTGR